MKRAHLLPLLFLAAAGVLAQQKTPEEREREKKYLEQAAKVNADTSKHYGWNHTASGALNLTQVSFKDWVAGGSNTLAYSVVLQGSSVLTWSGRFGPITISSHSDRPSRRPGSP